MESRDNYLNYNLPCISEEEINEVVDTLRSGWLTTGPKTKAFEKDFSKYIKTKHSIALSSCTAGLHVAMTALGIKAGDEVITTPYTFASTILAIMETGAKPVFVDVRDDTFNIDEEKIEKAITKKTKAILPVHFAGVPCEMDKIMKIAKEHGLFVIEDAAHAVGSEYKKKKIGSIGDITAFSFYATKNLTTGEGGMVTTDNDKLAEKIRILCLHGISKDSFNRYSKGGAWYYEVVEKGFKYNMTDIQSAIGIHQLRKLDKMNARRTEIAEKYNDGFNNVDGIIIKTIPADITNSWHLYILQLDLAKLKIGRDMFIDELKSRNIGTSVHFIPIPFHSLFQKELNVRPGMFINTDRIYERVISLPLYPTMTDQDVEYVIRAVKEIIIK